MKRLAVGFVIALVASLLSIDIAPALGPPLFIAITDGPVGSVVTVSSSDGCVAPAGVTQWVANVKFAQGGNPQLDFVDLTVAPDGSWFGSIRVPSSAVLGFAQLTAQCFDPSHSVSNTVTYSPVDFIVTPGSFDTGAVSGAVGSVVTVSSSDGCVAPAGVSQWVAIVDFAQGGSGQLAFADLTVAGDGSWSGSIRIPSSAVLGPAQITAQCFDPAHSVPNQFHYSPVDFTVTAGRFIATTDGAIGSVVTVRSTDGCIAPAGASQWVAIVNFAQGANGQLAFADVTVAADGSWSGSIRIPTSAVFGPAQITAQCFDPTHTSQTQIPYSPVGVSVAPGSFETGASSAPVGSMVTVRSNDGCAAPIGAVQWVAVIDFAQGAIDQLAFVDLTVATDGSWSGSILVPSSALLGPAQITAQCFDPTHASQTRILYSPVALTVESIVSSAPISSAATASALAVRLGPSQP